MKKIALLSVFALCVFAAGCNKNVDVENECVDGEECVVDVVAEEVDTVEEDAEWDVEVVVEDAEATAEEVVEDVVVAEENEVTEEVSTAEEVAE